MSYYRSRKNKEVTPKVTEHNPVYPPSEPSTFSEQAGSVHRSPQRRAPSIPSEAGRDFDPQRYDKETRYHHSPRVIGKKNRLYLSPTYDSDNVMYNASKKPDFIEVKKADLDRHAHKHAQHQDLGASEAGYAGSEQDEVRSEVSGRNEGQSAVEYQKELRAQSRRARDVQPQEASAEQSVIKPQPVEQNLNGQFEEQHNGHHLHHEEQHNGHNQHYEEPHHDHAHAEPEAPRSEISDQEDLRKLVEEHKAAHAHSHAHSHTHSHTGT